MSADDHSFVCVNLLGGTCGELLSRLAGDNFLGSSVSPASTPTKKIPGTEGEHPLRLTRQKADLEIEKSEFSLFDMCTYQFIRGAENMDCMNGCVSLQF